MKFRLNRKIHVCIVTTAHSVDDVRVDTKIANSFIEAGFHVSWVGPSHASSVQSNSNNDTIQYSLSTSTHRRINRLLAPIRIRRLASSVQNVDVYYAPDPDSASVALSLARKNGARVIFDVHEVYHGALLDRWLLGLQLQHVRYLIRHHISRICSRCDLVIGVNNAVLEQYVDINTNKLVVRNCAPLWFAEEEPADTCGTERSTFNIMHGKSDLGRGTIQVMKAAAISNSNANAIRILMFDQINNRDEIGISKLNLMIQEMNLSDVVVIRPSVSIKEMPRILQDCNVGLIAYGRGLGRDSLPNRLFEYMAAGLAIIAPVYSKEIAKIIEIEKCGILVDFEDPIDISRAIVYLYQNPQICHEMGRRSREAFIKRHNWYGEVKPLIDIIRRWYPGLSNCES